MNKDYGFQLLAPHPSTYFPIRCPLEHLLNDKIVLNEKTKRKFVWHCHHRIGFGWCLEICHRENKILAFWYALLCVPPRRNQKQCHVLKTDKSFGGDCDSERNSTRVTLQRRRKAWAPALRRMLVTEELLEGDSHPRLVSSWKIMPCFIAWHIVLLAEFQYVVKVQQLWELKAWHHGHHFLSFIDAPDTQSCSIQCCHNNAFRCVCHVNRFLEHFLLQICLTGLLTIFHPFRQPGVHLLTPWWPFKKTQEL